jgi:epoxide hydrolase
VKPFRIHVSDGVRDDLNRRIAATIFPEPTPGSEWSRGIPPDVLRRLVDFWRSGFDWRAEEERLNRYEHHVVTIDRADIHLARRRATSPGGIPVILTHGWPYTFNEMLPTLEAIDGAMDVIVPSLPGFAYSGVLPEPWSDTAVSDRWHTLMTDILGYERYITYGEDVGASISDRIAATYPRAVAGIVASHASFSARDRDGVELTVGEQAFFDALDQPGEGGYAHLQATLPDTLAAGLTDSPAGLLAWIAEKYAAWGPGGGLDPFTEREVLTPAMLYWTTRTIGTSFRPYAQHRDEPPHPLIEVPAALIIQQRERTYPRSLGEKSYLDICSFDVLETGGHFSRHGRRRKRSQGPSSRSRRPFVENVVTRDYSPPVMIPRIARPKMNSASRLYTNNACRGWRDRMYDHANGNTMIAVIP